MCSVSAVLDNGYLRGLSVEQGVERGLPGGGVGGERRVVCVVVPRRRAEEKQRRRSVAGGVPGLKATANEKEGRGKAAAW